MVKTIAGVEVVPGRLVKDWVTAGFHPDGAPIRVPFMVLGGTRPGPTLLVTAAVHGSEVGGCEAARRLLREELDPQKVRGTVVALPLANPLAVRYDSYYVVEDGLNLNRVFPGSANDTITPRLADLIFRQFVAPADYVVDLHANPQPAVEFCIVKLVGQTEVQRRSVEMARAFGITVLSMSSTYEKHRTGTLIEGAMAAGKPSVIVEQVSWRTADPASVEMTVNGLVNVLVDLGMLDGRSRREIPDKSIAGGVLSRIDVLCDRGGFAVPQVSVGSRVAKGRPVVRILDVFGDEVESVVSPRHGWVVAYPWSLNQFVGTGEAVAFVVFEEGGG
jgi:hypothetical protein